MSDDPRPRHIHPVPDPGWLARHWEPLLEPGLPIIDPHHHLWNRGGGYLLDELLADLETGHRIEATVFMQCGHAYRTDGPPELRPVGETEFIAGLAAEAARRDCATDVCAGIVGHVDMLLGDAVAPVLEAHLAAGAGRFRGIRDVTARNEGFVASIVPPPPAGVMADPRFGEALRHFPRLGLSFDAWLYHPQLGELTTLAREHPRTCFVMNHAGGPLGLGPYAGRGETAFAEWVAGMRMLATCPNVRVKLGGLAMITTGAVFHTEASPPSSTTLAEAWRPYLELCIEAFGVGRCTFESNFPVDKAMCGYPVMWNGFKRVAHGATETEKAALFRDTAARVYRLVPDTRAVGLSMGK